MRQKSCGRARTATLVVLVAALASALWASAAPAKTTWLCRPGQASNPCAPKLDTTQFTPAGKKVGIVRPKRVAHPAIDCFYVYPTVSDQKSIQSNLSIDPEERSIALYQAARFSQYCRVFAPMYRQVTLQGLSSAGDQGKPAILAAFKDVERAWKDYLAHDNHGRGVVLIGHSQGTFHLTELIRKDIDAVPAIRRRLVSALLLGGNVLVRNGKDAGGSFRHVPACRRSTQLGCVVAYSTFDETPPPNAIFGRDAGSFAAAFGEPSGAGYQVLCTNPAALGGGSAPVDSVFPSAPFAPGTTIALANSLLGLTLPLASTPWVEIPRSFTAHCSAAGGAHVLMVRPGAGGQTPKAVPDATWGLHLLDVNIALGDLVHLVGRQAGAYAHAR